MPDDDIRRTIADLVSRVVPYDAEEERVQADIMQWIFSGAQLFRTQPPAVPSRHLAVYFALYDHDRRAILLVDHVKAGCWLLPGGHIDEGEDPRATVAREAQEELCISARFNDHLCGDDPFFVTMTTTRGPHKHIDITLWFVLTANRKDPISPDLREFRGTSWFALDDHIDWAATTFDPQMHRFVAKLTAVLDATADTVSASF